jgi:predicted DNA-binding transcriptional regulator YafY
MNSGDCRKKRMNRIDRLTAILIQLQSKKIVKARELAERFEISLRTVYRDIRVLEAAGVPIGSDAGIGYYLAEGFQLPPVMFTLEEAGALITAGKLLDVFADRCLQRDFDSALSKIKAILKTKDQEYLEKLQNSIAIDKSSDIDKSTEASFRSDIQFALVGNNVAVVEYFSAAGQSTSRMIEPLLLGFYGSKWYLIAFCRLRKAYREFRIDRIKRFTITNETFNRKKHGTSEKIFSELFPTVDLQKVILRITKSASVNLLKSKCRYGLIAEKEMENKVEMTFLVDSLPILGRWLLEYGDDVEIDHPDELKFIMQQYVRELAKQYLD